ncbi:hypothetical protein [Streptomyces sp. NPDC005784]|uniref:hypothetical protein n=1 Tax=Streptomyces sp. NPDC005784 TaxID=3364731 RepID=UPI0036982D8D
MPDPIAVPDPLETATLAFEALLDASGPGVHHLVCSATSALGSYASASVVVQLEPGDPVRADADLEGSLMFCHVLAQTSRFFTCAAVFTRTYTPGGACRVRGWTVVDGWPQPMQAADVFAAYCTDFTTGAPLPPEPGTDYQAGLPVPTPAGLP